MNATIRKDFPLLNGKERRCYLDSACMTLKPRQVITEMLRYYEEFPACEGRSQHILGEQVENLVEQSRRAAARFFSAKQDEIVFTKNATEGLNLVAKSIARKGDVVLTTDKEHNSNLLPWLQQEVKHEIVPSKDGLFDFDAFEKKVRTVQIVAVAHTSNLDGTTVPLKEIVKEAHKHGAIVVADAAQSAPHYEINVKKLDIDFLAVSGHKMLGPTGVGFLYGRKDVLEKLPPFLTGGGTAVDSWYDHAQYELLPYRFEAGLQNYSGIIGMRAAFEYLEKIGLAAIAKHEVKLNKLMTDELQETVDIIGPRDPAARGSIFNFTMKKLDHHTAAIMLSEHNVFVRSGAHCVHSWYNANKLPGSVRASLYLYNDEQDVQQFVQAVKKIAKI